MGIIGQRFGRLLVLEKSDTKTSSRTYFYLCLCDCGNKKLVLKYNLVRGYVKSCGCLSREISSKLGKKQSLKNIIHGKSKTRAYREWLSMKTRCYNEKCHQYPSYGGRGIEVDSRWHEFEIFYEDMGDPLENVSLDRIDNNGSYSKENCKWSTSKEQQNNIRTNRKIEYKNEIKNITQWADQFNISVPTLRGRLKLGWSIEEALEKPIERHIKK